MRSPSTAPRTEATTRMGIYDRDYERASAREGGMLALRMLSFNTWLIIINVAIFVMMALSPRIATFIFDYGHFSTHMLIEKLQVWRLITFQFIHAGIGHVFFNMFGLWVFGGMVERHLGFKRYAAFYLVCGIFGALMYLLLNLGGYLAVKAFGVQNAPLLLFENKATPLIGASAGVFGVIMACAYIAPNAIVQLIFPPVPLRLKIMAYAYVGIAAFNLVLGGNNAGGDAAHIGGAIAGYFFIRNSHLLLDFFDIFGDSRPRGPKVRDAAPARRAGVFGGGRAPNAAEVDRILAKVRDEGIASLSEGERRALREATEAQRRW